MITVLTNRFIAIHTKYVSFLSLFQHPLLLLVRLYWGYDFFQTGLGKLNNLERTAEFFASLDIPFPMMNAVAAGSTELFCGALMMIGFGSRYVTVPLIIILSAAYATDDRDALVNIFNDAEAFVAATPFLHLFASLMVLFFGPGALSADEFLRRRSNKR